MGYASLTRHLDTQPETVFDYITDPANLTTWLTLFDDVDSMVDRLDHVGAKFEADLHVGGGSHVWSMWEVTKIEAPRLIHLQGGDEHDDDIEVWISIGAWEGGCEFELDVSYELPSGLTNAIADRVVVGRRLGRELKRSVELLAGNVTS